MRKTGFPFLKRLSCFCAFCLVFILASCVSGTGKNQNNHLTFGDLIKHLEECNLKVTHVIMLRPDVAQASSAVALRIDGQEVGIYKYDANMKKQKAKLEYAKEHGFIYLCAIKYPALVNGSFVMVDSEKHPDKRKIQRAFESFSRKK